MKFKNVTPDALYNDAEGFYVEAGADLEVTAERAVGLIFQCIGEGGNWAPADDEARAAVAAALTPPAPVVPADSAPKAAWLAHANEAGVAVDPAATKADIQAAVKAAKNEGSN